MRRTWSIVGTVVAALAVVALLVWGLRPAQRSPLSIGTQVGQLAPDFTLQRLDGPGSLRLWSLRGHPVWINFFASWCAPCNAEAYDVAQAAEHSPGLRVVGVNLANTEASLAKVDAFVQQYGIKYPVVLDTKGSVANSYGVQAIPTSFFIDRQGVIRAAVSKPLDPAEIATYLGRIGVHETTAGQVSP